MKRLSTFVAVLLLSACGPVKPPQPPAAPKPEPQCVEGQNFGCWTEPPGLGWMFACAIYEPSGTVVGVELQRDPALCQVKPQPPAQSASAPLIPDEALQGLEDAFQAKMWTAVDAAIRRWRAAHPEAWRGDGACLSNGPAGIDAAFQGISDELLAAGIVAGQSINAYGKRSDCIFVKRTPPECSSAGCLYEEVHPFDYARACVATGSNAVKRLYRRVEGTDTPIPVPPVPAPVPAPAPVPTPPAPPVGDACGVPVPPPLEVFGLKCEAGKKWCDGTPKVYGCNFPTPGKNFCREIGLGTMPGQPNVERCVCPAGNEEDGAKRSACEAKIVGEPGPPARPRWKSDGKVELHPENPFLARCSDCTYIEICKADGTKCTKAKLK